MNNTPLFQVAFIAVDNCPAATDYRLSPKPFFSFFSRLLAKTLFFIFKTLFFMAMAMPTAEVFQKAIEIFDTYDHHRFLKMISNLPSSDEDKLVYDCCLLEWPDDLCFGLFFLFFCVDITDEERDTCAILVCDLLSCSSRFSVVLSSESNVVSVKQFMLHMLKESFSEEISKALWNISSQIFIYIVVENHGEWPGVVNYFCECLHSECLYVQDNAILFFLNLPTSLSEELRPYVQNINSILQETLKTSTGERKFLRLASLLHLIQHMSTNYYFLFRDLVIPLVETVSYFLDTNISEDNAQRSLKKLKELVGAEPRFFDLHLNHVYNEMLVICRDRTLGNEMRVLAIEVMYAFDDVSLQRVKKRILRPLCSELINMISFTPNGSTNCPLEEKFITRISVVDKKFCFTYMWNDIAIKFKSRDWRERYAAVAVLGLIAKGCAEALTDDLNKVMKVVRTSMTDPSRAVHFATIRAVKSMSLGLNPHTLDEYADVLISWLHLEILHQALEQTAAVSAICSLCENCSSCIVEPRLGTIVRKLIEFLKSEDIELQKESLNTLTSFARLSKDLFCQDYDSVIPPLKEHLAGSTSKSLQVNSANCICTIAMAVGNDIFSKDAKEVVALLLSVRRCLLEDDHNLQVTLLQAWEQLLKCLGSHFYPYAKDLMPDLLNYTGLDSNSVTEHVIVTKKLKACKLLLRLNKKLKGKFFPWINQVSDIMVPLVKFHDKDIRKIASSALPKLLLSAKLSVEDEEFQGITNSYLDETVVRFVSSLLEALDEETDGKVCATIVKSLTSCIKIDGSYLNETTIQQTANAIEQVLKATSKKHFSKEEVVTDLEKKIIKEVVNYIRILMEEIYEESSNALVEKLLACIRMMRRDDATAKEKETALLTFTEISIECKEAAKRY